MRRAIPFLPVLAACLGIASFSTMDAVMKGASLAVGVYSALVLRTAIGALLILPIWVAQNRAGPARASLLLHAKRSAVVACMAPLFFWGLVRMPISEAIALSFIAPLIALYLAAVLLGESIQPRAIAASLVGFAGVVIIAAARLGDEAGPPGSGWAIAAVLLSAMFYAWNLILQRQQALIAGPVEVALFQNLFVSLFLLPAAPWLWEWAKVIGPPFAGVAVLGADVPVLGIIAVASLLAVVSLMLLTWAYARAEAQVLLPVEYTGFAWAALFGWLWFDEAVTWTTVAGVAMIVGACWIAARKSPPHSLH
jgi:S-adenosylmethionine uptake transporter